MSGVVLTAFLLLHFVCWIIQVMINQVGGSADCIDVNSLACGSPVLGNLAGLAERYNDVSGLRDTIGFLIGALGTFFSSLMGLVFFSYGWLSGGGQIVDLVVLVIRMILGVILLGTLGRIASSVIGGRLG